MEPADAEPRQGETCGQPTPEPRTPTDNVPERSPVVYSASPPYWQHNRSASYATQVSVDTPHAAIILEDHTESPLSPSSSQLWAKAVAIDDYTVVRGYPTGIGAYVVFNCTVQTLDGGPMTIRKRYSEFDALRAQLLAAFPQSTSTSLPPLPPKSAVYKFRPKFLERRRAGLAYFLNCVMLNPEYSGSEIVKEFICLKS